MKAKDKTEVLDKVVAGRGGSGGGDLGRLQRAARMVAGEGGPRTARNRAALARQLGATTAQQREARGMRPRTRRGR